MDDLPKLFMETNWGKSYVMLVSFAHFDQKSAEPLIWTFSSDRTGQGRKLSHAHLKETTNFTDFICVEILFILKMSVIEYEII